MQEFLVKGGEDLRQDQRIQMLFSYMSELFRSDAACARRGLELATYQVIPVSLNVGLIEWVPDTQTVLSVLKDSFAQVSGVRSRYSPDI